MKRIVKAYETFINEDLQNEGLGKFVNTIIDKIKGLFQKYGGIVGSMAAQVAGKRSKYGEGDTIPYGVTIYPSQRIVSILKANDINYVPPVDDDSVNEAVVGMAYPDPKAGVIDVDKTTLLNIVDRVMTEDDEAPLMIWGAPGIGKTSIVKIVAKNQGGTLIDVQLTTYTPEDFFMPVLNPQTSENPRSRRGDRVPQRWLPMYHESEGLEGDTIANQGEGGIIFFDEISRASTAIRAIALNLVQFGELDGGWIIGSKWKMVAASNREIDDETNALEFGTALPNRFQQINYVPTTKDYSDYAFDAKNKEGEFIFDRRIIAFLNWSKGHEFLHKMDPSVSKVFPSPRSWEKAAIAWGNMKKQAERQGIDLKPDAIYTQALAPSIGREAATAFIAYYELSQKIDIDKIKLAYTNPDAAPLPPKTRVGDSDYELDSAYILASALAYEHKDRRLTPDEATNLIQYAIRVDNPIFGLQIITAITEIHPYLKEVSLRNTDPVVTAWTTATIQKFIPKYPGTEKDIAKLQN